MSILSELDLVPFFWHSIDCGDGVVSKGYKSLDLLNQELHYMKLPDLRGKTVLDIGAWDGFFSFKAEELGAHQVIALDHFVWSHNLELASAYSKKCIEERTTPYKAHLVPGLYNPGTYPGKLGFDTIHRIKSSKVAQYIDDFMTMDLVKLGQFDVTFYLGVLYHMEEPLEALKRLALVTRELAIIETASIYLPDHENLALFEFYAKDELNPGDPTNRFAPNLVGLQKACIQAGFKDVKVTSPYPPTLTNNKQQIVRPRLTIHAYK